MPLTLPQRTLLAQVLQAVVNSASLLYETPYPCLRCSAQRMKNGRIMLSWDQLDLQQQNSSLVVEGNQAECTQLQIWGQNCSFLQWLRLVEQGQAAQGDGKNTEFKTGPSGSGLWAYLQEAEDRTLQIILRCYLKIKVKRRAKNVHECYSTRLV